MPTLFHDRLGISLYDAQFSAQTRVPIHTAIIDQISKGLARFKHICTTFGVPAENIRVVATEATRTAENSQEFRDSIHRATGWTVELLSKEQEGSLGSWGVASSLGEVTGLVMDLGGGSTQLSWIVSKDGEVQMAEKPVSMPYGAAALTMRIKNTPEAELKAELTERLTAAYESLELPDRLKGRDITLYLSGGGFRGFGYLLLSQHSISPYPIPIINGFEESVNAFSTLAETPPSAETLSDTFRISTRRAAQLPAVSMLVRTVTKVLPRITNVTFCQGGVREGSLYSRLPKEIRAQDPLVVATLPYKPNSADRFKEILDASLPPSTPGAIRKLTTAIANLITVYSENPKESQASCGLHSTTNGILAGVQGLPHLERAMVALVLCQRWKGEVADGALKRRFASLVGGELDFWCRYLGAVAGVVGAVYPSGNIVWGDEQLQIVGKDKGEDVKVSVLFGKDNLGLESQIEEIGKVGKNKRCPLGWRKKVKVSVA